jgi:hypothetical protein
MFLNFILKEYAEIKINLYFGTVENLFLSRLKLFVQLTFLTLHKNQFLRLLTKEKAAINLQK